MTVAGAATFLILLPQPQLQTQLKDFYKVLEQL